MKKYRIKFTVEEQWPPCASFSFKEKALYNVPILGIDAIETPYNYKYKYVGLGAYGIHPIYRIEFSMKSLNIENIIEQLKKKNNVSNISYKEIKRTPK